MANKERRITLFINRLSGGGAERVTCNLANYLFRHGFSVDVIAMAEVSDEFDLEEGINKIFLIKKGEHANKIKKFLIRQKRLKQYVIDNQDVSCYIVMLPVTIFMLTRLKRFTKAKMIISERNNPDSYGPFYKAMMRYGAKKCDGLVVQTKEIAKWYSDVGKKVVIPNAINDDIVFPERDHIEKKIVAAGRLNEQKNYPMLIEAFAIFNKGHPEYKLEIYGQGELKNKLNELIGKYRLEKNVKLMGYVKNVSECIANAACFVMTSNFEGMPNALIEAMCIGLPCIATDSDGGGVRDLIINSKNGIMVKKGAVEDLAKEMGRIVDDEKLSEELSKNALKTREILASGKIYAKWLDFINLISGEIDG